MSPYTGKGASLAFADAMALANILETEAFFTSAETRAKLMNKFVDDMLKRRKKQRKGGVFIQRVVFSGKNFVKVAVRDNFLRCYNVLGHGMEAFRFEEQGCLKVRTTSNVSKLNHMSTHDIPISNNIIMYYHARVIVSLWVLNRDREICWLGGF